MEKHFGISRRSFKRKINSSIANALSNINHTHTTTPIDQVGASTSSALSCDSQFEPVLVPLTSAITSDCSSFMGENSSDQIPNGQNVNTQCENLSSSHNILDDVTDLSSDGLDLSDEEENDYTSDNYKIREWAIRHHITHITINDLLSILRPKMDLPKDARTLLATPRSVDVKSVAPGQYCHFGFDNCLMALFTNNSIPRSIELCIEFCAVFIKKNITLLW